MSVSTERINPAADGHTARRILRATIAAQRAAQARNTADRIRKGR